MNFFKAILLFCAGALAVYSFTAGIELDFSKPHFGMLAFSLLFIIVGWPRPSRKRSTTPMKMRVATGEITSTAELDERLLSLAKHESKIAAIKLFREEKGVGLKDAKEYIEYLEKQQQGNRNAL